MTSLATDWHRPHSCDLSVHQYLVDHLGAAHHKVKRLAHSHELGGCGFNQEG